MLEHNHARLKVAKKIRPLSKSSLPAITPMPANIPHTSLKLEPSATRPHHLFKLPKIAADYPGYSVGAFTASGTPVPSFPQVPFKKPFPDRRVVRNVPKHYPPLPELEQWATSVGLVLGPLIPTAADRLRVLQLLWQYRHLNREDLTDLPCTDLITHRVRIAPGTKPASAKSQKRWPPHTEWWLRKLVQDGLAGGVYELTEPANGRLSQWNARAVMVDKVENPGPDDEPRMTFDYSRVTELLPGAHLELS